MLTNKTTCVSILPRKSTRISPLKQKQKIVQRKQINRQSKYITKLPSVKNNTMKIIEDHNKYEIGEMIGQGAYSKVYKAIRSSDQLACVIKIIDKQKVGTQEKKKAFKRELQALSIPKHRNLVSLIDQYETATQYAIVMEYFSDQSLSSFMKTKRPVQNSCLQNITKQISQGLLHLHSYGISHRDIKPQNILINQETQQIKIIDFGFATSHELEQIVVAGTPQYMPPQLINRKGYQPAKADVWSFGIMLYWLALGYYPQDADQKKKKLNSVANIMKKWQNFVLYFPADINPGLEYLLTKMLNVDPKKRISIQNILDDTWVKPKLFKDQILKLMKMSKNVQNPLIVLS